MAQFKFFPPEIIELQKELRDYWPMISAEASQGKDMFEQMGIIAARLGILLDGVYHPVDLADMLLKKLRELRTSSIALPDPRTVEVQIKEGSNTVTIEEVPAPAMLPSPKKAD